MLLTSSGIGSECLNEVAIGSNILQPIGRLSGIDANSMTNIAADRINRRFPIVLIAISVQDLRNIFKTIILYRRDDPICRYVGIAARRHRLAVTMSAHAGMNVN